MVNEVGALANVFFFRGIRHPEDVDEDDEDMDDDDEVAVDGVGRS